MTTMIVVALALGAVALFYTAARNRSKQSRNSFRPVDVQALRTLLDRDDEIFLREHVSYRRFCRLKRRRISVTARYVGRVAGNASVVMRLGESARRRGTRYPNCAPRFKTLTKWSAWQPHSPWQT